MKTSVLKTDGLCKRFDALQASRHVTLDVQRGEIHALIGPNGAGKSTLIQQIAGALKPDAGQIFIHGENVTKLDVAARARLGLARTFQISALAMQDTVLQNALLGVVGTQGRGFNFLRPPAKDKDMLDSAQCALRRMDLLEYSGKRASELSHGQRRQLEIAIALTLKPCVFVMDEPMAGLGAQGTQRMIMLLAELKQEAPILMVEHDMEAVFALADRISVLVYGQIIATGTVEEIKRDSEVQRAYLGHAW